MPQILSSHASPSFPAHVRMRLCTLLCEASFYKPAGGSRDYTKLKIQMKSSSLEDWQGAEHLQTVATSGESMP